MVMFLNAKLKVGIYLRLSNEDKDKYLKNNSESIKNQRNMLIDYIDKNPNLILKDEYCDEDLSGAGTYRPEFERLIKDCESKKLDIVLCKSQSRFSRDMEIVEKYINNKFLEWNIRFISLSDNADTENMGNKKSRQINGLVNEWYLEDVSNNIRSAFKAKMKQGEFISPFAPFGYEISKQNNNKLVIDQIAKDVVKTIYNLYLKGLGFTSIAKYLNDKNIPSPSLYKYQKGIKLNIVSNKPRIKIKWTNNAVKTILTNEIYIGNLIQGKRTTVSYKNHKIRKKNKDEWIKVLNTHEAIIDKDVFDKVQMEIKKRKKPMKKGLIHIFSGKVFCLECNSYMRKKNSNCHEYLRCSNDNCLNKTSIRYDVLYDLILKAINAKIDKYYDIDIIENLAKNNIFNSTIKSLEKEKNTILNELAKTKNYLKLIYEDKASGIITTDEFKDLYLEYSKNKGMYESKLKGIEIKKQNYEIKNYNDIFCKYQKLEHLNNFTIQEFITKIYIGKYNPQTNNRDIKIEWNF